MAEVAASRPRRDRGRDLGLHLVHLPRLRLRPQPVRLRGPLYRLELALRDHRRPARRNGGRTDHYTRTEELTPARRLFSVSQLAVGRCRELSRRGPVQPTTRGAGIMVNPRRTTLLLGTALVAGGLAVAGGPAMAQKKGGSLVYANVSAVGTMDPHVANAVVDLETIHHVHEGLVDMGEDYAPSRCLPARWTSARTGGVFTFALRKGVKFSNGKEMTAADVHGELRALQEGEPERAGVGRRGGMETPDPYTFVIKLNKPNSLFVEVMKTPTYSFSIIPAEQKDKPARDGELVGTGPYRSRNGRKDSHSCSSATKTTSPTTAPRGRTAMPARRPLYLDSIRYNSVPEANTRLAAIQSGGADSSPPSPVTSPSA